MTSADSQAKGGDGHEDDGAAAADDDYPGDECPRRHVLHAGDEELIVGPASARLSGEDAVEVGFARLLPGGGAGAEGVVVERAVVVGLDERLGERDGVEGRDAVARVEVACV